MVWGKLGSQGGGRIYVQLINASEGDCGLDKRLCRQGVVFIISLWISSAVGVEQVTLASSHIRVASSLTDCQNIL